MIVAAINIRLPALCAPSSGSALLRRSFPEPLFRDMRVVASFRSKPAHLKESLEFRLIRVWLRSLPRGPK